MKKIAILGSTGYIGKSLVYEFSKETEYEVYLFVRSKEKIDSFLRSIGIDKAIDNKFRVHTMSEFGLHEYSVVINAAGIGSPAILKKNPEEIFKVTEDLDSLVINYIQNKRDILYINLSSGAVYNAPIENPEPKDYYSFAKKKSEDRHRKLSNLNIVDLRVFNFFSRFYDSDAGFLMSDITDSIQCKRQFKTTSSDIVRDFITPEDLLSLIKIVMEQSVINDAFDVYSAKSITKFELLKAMKDKYNLEFVVDDGDQKISPTGTKNEYVPKDMRASILGYSPKYSSLSGIEHELDALV